LGVEPIGCPIGVTPKSKSYNFTFILNCLKDLDLLWLLVAEMWKGGKKKKKKKFKLDFSKNLCFPGLNLGADGISLNNYIMREMFFCFTFIPPKGQDNFKSAFRKEMSHNFPILEKPRGWLDLLFCRILNSFFPIILS